MTIIFYFLLDEALPTIIINYLTCIYFLIICFFFLIETQDVSLQECE